MKNKNLIQIYGVLASPMQLSAELSALNVSHIVVNNSLRAEPRLKELGFKQPALPIVVPSLTIFRRQQLTYERQIMFVCGPLAELQTTNIRVIKDWRSHLRKALEYAIANPLPPDWKLVISEPTMEDFVHKATKPSFLNHVQAELYRITPYDLRKSVQALVISYLGGTESAAKLRAKLASSYKLDRLRELMKDPKCQVLRQAVADYRKIGDEEKVAKAHGVETFEIMYLFKSSFKKSISS
jgi:hypothetical protein